MFVIIVLLFYELDDEYVQSFLSLSCKVACKKAGVFETLNSISTVINEFQSAL